MSRIDSARRIRRSFGPAHSPPVTGVSFIASPVPTPRNTRPGASSASVANAWATIAGL